jgi:CBS domain containing-hemolysin-like protein
LISGLVTRMQDQRQWLAIVTGPGGRTLGLVTIEDLVAELIGEISEDGVGRGPTPPRHQR